MSDLMDNLEFSIVYINDLLIITSGLFEENLSKVEEFMKSLQFSGLKHKIDKWKLALPKV